MCYYLNGDVLMNNLACKNEDAIYFEKIDKDFRLPFYRDIDRILY